MAGADFVGLLVDVAVGGAWLVVDLAGLDYGGCA